MLHLCRVADPDPGPVLKSAGDRRPGALGNDLDNQNDILQRAIRTRLPTGSMSPDRNTASAPAKNRLRLRAKAYAARTETTVPSATEPTVTTAELMK